VIKSPGAKVNSALVARVGGEVCLMLSAITRKTSIGCSRNRYCTKGFQAALKSANRWQLVVMEGRKSCDFSAQRPDLSLIFGPDSSSTMTSCRLTRPNPFSVALLYMLIPTYTLVKRPISLFAVN
jgi:hypothetical protein